MINKKFTKNKKSTRLRCLSMMICSLGIGISAFSTSDIQRAKAATTIQVTVSDTENTYNTTDTTVILNGVTLSNNASMIQINGINMISVKGILNGLLNCPYQYNEETRVLKVKGAGGEHVLSSEINSWNGTLDGNNITLPYTIIRGVDTAANTADFYVPADYFLTSLGYTYNYYNNTLNVTSPYLFSLSSADDAYDSTMYSNMLSGFHISHNSANTENSIQASTSQNLNTANFSINSDSKEYSVTMSFAATKNGLGTQEKTINNGIIRSVHIWEDTTKRTTYIKIYYDKKYIYTQKILTKGAKITFSKGNFALKVALPDGVSFSKLKTTDQYWKKRFIIVIPGKRKSFYQKNPPLKNSSLIKSITIKETSAGNTQIFVTTTSLKGYKLLKGNDYFTVDIGSPKNIYNNIIMLDAGHGKKDSGATAGGVKEKNLCLNILYNKAKEYFDATSSNVKAYWTRHDDTFINLYERPKYSKKYNADLFLSLHMNYSTSKKAKGTEVYYSKKNNKKSFSGLNSKIFATRMRNTIVNDLKTTNRGVKQAGFVVIKNNTVPAVLVELGFISNQSERSKLKTAAYQKKAAKALYKGVSETFKKYPTTRSK